MTKELLSKALSRLLETKIRLLEDEVSSLRNSVSKKFEKTEYVITQLKAEDNRHQRRMLQLEETLVHNSSLKTKK